MPPASVGRSRRPSQPALLDTVLTLVIPGRSLGAVKPLLPGGAVIVTAVVALVLLAFGPGGRDVIDAAAAQEAARNWTGWERTDPPRRRHDGWEVDVHRADGSVVEVNLGPKLERDGSIEVDIVRNDRTVLDVNLDRDLRVTGVDREELGDE
jgi:hypothetical protein